MVGDAERLHRLVELAAAVLAEPVLLVGGEVLQLGDEDLAHLAGGAGHEGDADALGDVPRHRRAVADATRRRGGRGRAGCAGRVMTSSLVGPLDPRGRRRQVQRRQRQPGAVGSSGPRSSSSQPSWVSTRTSSMNAGASLSTAHGWSSSSSSPASRSRVTSASKPSARSRATTARASSSSKKIALTGVILHRDRWLVSEDDHRLGVAERPGRPAATHRRERPRDRGPRLGARRAHRPRRAARRPQVRRAAGAGRAPAARPGGARGVPLGRLRRARRAVVPPGHLDERGLLRHRGHRWAPGRGDDLVLHGQGRREARLAGDLRRPGLAGSTATCCWSRPSSTRPATSPCGR